MRERESDVRRTSSELHQGWRREGETEDRRWEGETEETDEVPDEKEGRASRVDVDIDTQDVR